MLTQNELIDKCAEVARQAFLEAMSTDYRVTQLEAEEKGKFIHSCILSLKSSDDGSNKSTRKNAKKNGNK